MCSTWFNAFTSSRSCVFTRNVENKKFHRLSVFAFHPWLIKQVLLISVQGNLQNKNHSTAAVEAADGQREATCHITFCACGHAGPTLDCSVVRFLTRVFCMCFCNSQARGRIPFIPNILAWRRRAALPLGPARGAQPWCAMLSVVPKAGQHGKSWVDPFQNQHYMHCCSYPPRVPSAQWKQQQPPQSQALFWAQGGP